VFVTFALFYLHQLHNHRKADTRRTDARTDKAPKEEDRTALSRAGPAPASTATRDIKRRQPARCAYVTLYDLRATYSHSLCRQRKGSGNSDIAQPSGLAKVKVVTSSVVP
jgi:hypothetical protein